MERILVKTFVHADGKRRIRIEKRADAGFTFAIERLVYHYDEDLREQLGDYEMIWTPFGRAGGIYETQAIAEREALASKEWLEEL